MTTPSGEPRPWVTVVTPSFQQGKFLEESIRSVEGQAYPNLEHVVIDGGSTDGTVEILRRISSRGLAWVSEPDRGQTDALNKGFARAKGEILGWLNADDVYRPGAVKEAVDFLIAHRDVAMVYGDADYIDTTGKVIGRFPAAATDYARLRRGYVHIPQQSAFFRAEIWRQVGPLDPSFYFAMDYDLWVRIAAVAPIQYVRRVWAGFRLHPEAKTLASADRCWPEMIRVHRRLGGGFLSVIYAKFIVRRVLEPFLPARLRARIWLQSWALNRRGRREMS